MVLEAVPNVVVGDFIAVALDRASANAVFGRPISNSDNNKDITAKI